MLKPEDTPVIYREGPFRWSKTHLGILKWTSSDHFQLIVIDKDRKETTVFDESINQLKKVGGALTYLTFYFKNKLRFRLDVAGLARKPISIAPDMLANEAKSYENSSVGEWVTALGAKGVKLRYLNGRAFIVLVTSLTFAVIIAATLLVLVVGPN